MRPSEDIKILEFNQNQKSDKVPFIIFADFEYLIEKTEIILNIHLQQKMGTYSIRFFGAYNILI